MAKKHKPIPYPTVDRTLRDIDWNEIPEPSFPEAPNTEDIKISCACGNVYLPPWKDKLPFEFHEIQSADGRIWQTATIPVKCSKCGASNDLVLPHSGKRGFLDIYGDESIDDSGSNRLVYMYAFVAFQPDVRMTARQKLLDCKKKILPLVDPDSWALHVQPVRSLEWRKKRSSPLSTSEVDALLTDLLNFIGQSKSSRFVGVTVFNVLGKFKVNGKTVAEVRDNALTSALFTTTYHLTSQGFDLSFTLEAQKDDHSQNRIEMFVERIGRGLRYSLTYHWISHGRFVRLPVTAPKNSSFELDYADLIAWTCRRYFHKHRINRESELPLELIGEVLWGVRTSKDFVTHYSTGFDWQHFFPDVIKPHY